MKRYKVLCLVLALMLVFSLGACASKESGEGEGEAPAPQEVTYLTMGTGGVSGTWYPVGGVLAGAMSKSGVANVSAQTSAASIENIRLASSGERQLGMATGGLLVFARDGVEMFAGESHANLASLANMMFMQCQFLVSADSGINSLSELDGQNVGTGAPGSGDEVFARGILEALGVYDKVKPMQLSYAEQVTAFKDRGLDMVYAFASAPTSAMLDAASQADVKMIGLTPEEIAKVQEKFPFLVETTLTPDHYTFITEPLTTLGSYTTLFASTDVPEDVIYEALKAMYNDLPTIQASHGAMASFTAEEAVMGLPIDLHPGAEKYYKEIGVID